jgi:hypothetical protein
MKKLLLVLLVLSLTFSISAQQSKKIKEVGIVFSDLDNFGFSYKTGTDRQLYRFNALFLSGSKFNVENDFGDNYNSTYDVSNQDNVFGFNVSVGKEFRKSLSSRVDFRYGLDLSFNMRNTTDKNTYINSQSVLELRSNKTSTYQPGVNLVLGLNYRLSDQFVLGAEVLPYFGYEFGERKTTIDSDEYVQKISGYSFNLSSSSLLLSLAYRF